MKSWKYQEILGNPRKIKDWSQNLRILCTRKPEKQELNRLKYKNIIGQVCIKKFQKNSRKILEKFQKKILKIQKYYWLGWYDAAGKGHEDYTAFVELSNEAAHQNNFADTGEMWRMRYEGKLSSQKILEDILENSKQKLDSKFQSKNLV